MILHATPTDERGLKLHLKKMYAEQRVALVIGNADYDAFADLRNPINDARAIRDVLETRNFFSLPTSSLGAYTNREVVNKEAFPFVCVTNKDVGDEKNYNSDMFNGS